MITFNTADKTLENIARIAKSRLGDKYDITLEIDNTLEELEGKIECIDYDGDTLCISDSDNNISTYNKRGKLIGRTKLDTSAQDVTVKDKKCYALCFGLIVQLDVKTKLK